MKGLLDQSFNYSFKGLEDDICRITGNSTASFIYKELVLLKGIIQSPFNNTKITATNFKLYCPIPLILSVSEQEQMESVYREFLAVIEDMKKVSYFLRTFSNLCRTSADFICIFDEEIQKWILHYFGSPRSLEASVITLNPELIHTYRNDDTMQILRGRFYLSALL